MNFGEYLYYCNKTLKNHPELAEYEVLHGVHKKEIPYLVKDFWSAPSLDMLLNTPYLEIDPVENKVLLRPYSDKAVEIFEEEQLAFPKRYSIPAK